MEMPARLGSGRAGEKQPRSKVGGGRLPPMTRPWETVETVDTHEGAMTLLRRGERELLITIDGRVLMNGVASRSEIRLAELACAALAAHPTPRILLGGLGLGITLKAALECLGPGARITVAELNHAVVRWCRGPAADLNGSALSDPRVEVRVADVADLILAAASSHARLDAIVLDLYEGPHEATQGRDDPFYGPEALLRAREALAPGGVLAVWSEEPDRAFERRLDRAGFRTERRRAGKGGRRHAIYLARAGQHRPRG